MIGDDLVGRPGVADYDPLRLVLDTRAHRLHRLRGRRRAAQRLRRPARAGDRRDHRAASSAWASRPTRSCGCAGDVDEIVKRISRPAAPSRPSCAAPAALQQRDASSSPRDAFLGAREVVAVEDAVGRVSCESIAGYPPGIPALLPGERITAEHRRLPARARRARGRGCTARPTRRWRTIHVLAD